MEADDEPAPSGGDALAGLPELGATAAPIQAAEQRVLAESTGAWRREAAERVAADEARLAALRERLAEAAPSDGAAGGGVQLSALRQEEQELADALAAARAHLQGDAAPGPVELGAATPCEAAAALRRPLPPAVQAAAAAAAPCSPTLELEGPRSDGEAESVMDPSSAGEEEGGSAGETQPAAAAGGAPRSDGEQGPWVAPAPRRRQRRGRRRGAPTAEEEEAASEAEDPGSEAAAQPAAAAAGGSGSRHPLDGPVNARPGAHRASLVVDDGDPLVWQRRRAQARALRRSALRTVQRRAAARVQRRDAPGGESSDDEGLSPDEDEEEPPPAGGAAGEGAQDEEGDSDNELDEVVFSGAPAPRPSSSGRPRGRRPPLRVPGSVWDSLFPYQQTCIKWLWEIHQQRHGGIIGDEMGLGKTVQVVAFIGALHRSELLRRPALVVCPLTVLKQWVREFHKWAPRLRCVVLHSSGSFRGTTDRLLQSLDPSSSVCVTSYHAVRENTDAFRAYNFHYVILDEGHLIRNHASKATIAVKQLPTVHRLVLTGSPVQNRLTELWSLFDFIYPGKLGTLSQFQRNFETSINIGGFQGASREQVQAAYRSCLRLRNLTAPYMLRRLKRDVGAQLPQKTEEVLFCRLTAPQVRSYVAYLQSDEMQQCLAARQAAILRANQDRHDAANITYRRADGGSIEAELRSPAALRAVQILRRICNHPQLHGEPDEDVDPVESSGKLRVVDYVLQRWKAEGHKVLLFSQSRPMLDILERFAMCKGYSFMRMDGSTQVSDRLPLIDRFNRDGTFLALLTPKVGGLGVNLVGADRVLIYDPDWNPMTDLQARERAWRIGQRRDVVIYRLVTVGTIEEKMFQRQVFKSYLTDRVLNDPTQRRFFCPKNLRDLFTLSSDYKDILDGTRRTLSGSDGPPGAKRPRGISQLRPPSPLRSFAGGDVDLEAALEDMEATPERPTAPAAAAAAAAGPPMPPPGTPRAAARGISPAPVIERVGKINVTPWGFEPVQPGLSADDLAEEAAEGGEGDPPAAPCTPRRSQGRAGGSTAREPSVALSLSGSLAVAAATPPPPPRGPSATDQHRRMVRSLLTGDQVEFATSFDASMRAHCGGPIQEEVDRIAKSAARNLRRSGQEMRRRIEELERLASCSSQTPGSPHDLEGQTSRYLSRQGSAASLSQATGGAASQQEEAQLRLLHPDAAQPAKRRAAGEPLPEPPEPEPPEQSPVVSQGGPRQPCDKVRRGWSDLQHTFFGPRAAAREDEERERRATGGESGVAMPRSLAAAERARSVLLSAQSHDLYTRRLQPSLVGTLNPRSPEELASQQEERPPPQPAPRWCPPPVLPREDAPAPGLHPALLPDSLSSVEPAQPESTAPPAAAPPLREQLQEFIAGTGGGGCPTQRLVEHFRGSIGDAPGQLSRDEFRAVLVGAARFDKVRSIWVPRSATAAQGPGAQ
eukprot:TRINITY_DN2736_c0_g1_i2.p1 TRINITY_DN2736_c0_g1~~TRINITY_DN2736_c0_g1_i2.p1  ORF type:complete len:1478 (+),score=481.67 TRINITY_DN2736_c0_g1_i2:90-4436(+)